MKNSAKFTVVIKCAVVLLLLKELWLLLQVPSIANAVVSFVMIGQVPGTDRILSPDEMIRLLVVLFVVISSLIFHKELIRLGRHMFKRTGKLVARPQAIKMPIAPPYVVVAPTTSVVKLAKAKHLLEAFEAQIHRVAFITRSKVRIAAGHIHAVTLHIAAFAWIRLKATTLYAWKLTLVLYLLAALLVVRTWQWLRPYLHSFDRWLDYRLHQNEHTAALLDIGSDIQTTLRRWMEEARSLDDEESAAKHVRK